MKKLVSILSVFLLIFGLSGCGSSSNDACSAGEVEAVLVTDTGGVNDKSFNQGTWEGLQDACSELGIGASYIETQSEADLEGNLRQAAQQAPIVVASGFLFEKAIGKIAQEFPDTNFVIIDGQPTDENGNPLELDNVNAYFFNEEEAGYLVGYIAAKTSETKKIGFIGGLEIPSVQKFGWGYVQGAQAADPNVEVAYEYTNSFSDTAKGKTTAKTMFAAGCDVIFTAAGGVNNGAVEAAIEETSTNPNVKIIGVDRDMYEDGIYGASNESVILTSAIKKTGKVALDAVKGIKAGEDLPAVSNLSVVDGYVGLPETNPNLEGQEDLIKEAQASLEQTLNGDGVKSTKDEVVSTVTIKINGSL